MDNPQCHIGLESNGYHSSLTTPDSPIEDANLQITSALLWVYAFDKSIREHDTAYDTSKAQKPSLKGSPDNTSKIDKDLDLLLQFHQDRLTSAAKALQWHRNAESFESMQASISQLRERIEEHIQQQPPPRASQPQSPSPTGLESRKVRVLIDKHGTMEIDSVVIDILNPPSSSSSTIRSCPLIATTPFIPSSLDDHPHQPSQTHCIVHLDHTPTHPSLYTTHKTTSRQIYNNARTRVHLSPSIPPTTREVLLYNTHHEAMETSACTIYFHRDGKWITPADSCGPNLGVTRRLALERGLCVQGQVDVRGLRDGEGVWLSNAVRGFFWGVLRIGKGEENGTVGS